MSIFITAAPVLDAGAAGVVGLPAGQRARAHRGHARGHVGQPVRVAARGGRHRGGPRPRPRPALAAAAAAVGAGGAVAAARAGAAGHGHAAADALVARRLQVGGEGGGQLCNTLFSA